VALCAALYAWPLDWGLPSEYGWAPDELTPAAVLDGLGQRFANGWHAKYPPFHHAVLAAAYAPWLRAAPDARRHHLLFRAGRIVSLLMAAGTVVLVYLCGRELFGHLPALFAALVAGLSAPFTYYAKLANLDVPYLFWFSAALLAYLRLLEGHRMRHYVALAACAAAAIATKDQAYGLFALTAPYVVWALHRHRQATGAPRSVWATLGDRRLAAAAVTGTGALIVLDNIWLNSGGFAAHVELIMGSASRDFRMFDRSARGVAALAAATVRALVFTLGAPAAAAAAAGLALAAARWRENGRLLAALVPALSYWLCFVTVVLYLYDRFVLPIGIVLALFAGKALAEALARRGSTLLPLAAAGLVVAASGLRALSVDVLMARDSRYAVEDWLREHAPPPALVAAIGPLEYLPRLDGLEWRRLGPSMDRLRGVDPDFVVVNADFARRAEEGGSDAELYAALASGRAGYRLSLAQPASATLPFLDLATFRSGDPARVHSNLDKVGPEILVYVRDHTPPR
jgi:dolichyl-phosphate-mannose-protein mannosyltransferase